MPNGKHKTKITHDTPIERKLSAMLVKKHIALELLDSIGRDIAVLMIAIPRARDEHDWRKQGLHSKTRRTKP